MIEQDERLLCLFKSVIMKLHEELKMKENQLDEEEEKQLQEEEEECFEYEDEDEDEDEEEDEQKEGSENHLISFVYDTMINHYCPELQEVMKSVLELEGYSLPFPRRKK